MKLICMIYINKNIKLTQYWGHKVKGQGQICNYENNVFRVLIMHEWMNLDDVYTYDWFEYEDEVYQR